MKLIQAENGMNIFGQGIRIIIFTVPAIAAALALHRWAPDLARLPLPRLAIAIGAVLVLAGLVIWGTAVVQLLVGFPRGRLVSTGAYGICRNPIYGSVAFRPSSFALPRSV
jgi:protein-S-isoprenylcysteine O-methyltransferase Ste14